MLLRQLAEPQQLQAGVRRESRRRLERLRRVPDASRRTRRSRRRSAAAGSRMNQAMNRSERFDVLMTGSSASSGYSRHLLQPRAHHQQRLVHVGVDGELEDDPPHRVHALGRHLLHAFDALQLLFLLLDDFLFDFLRARAGPARFDRDASEFRRRASAASASDRARCRRTARPE